MKKTTIKKVLALVVGVLIIAASLTAGFSAFAEIPAYYGTAEDGFSSVLSSWPGRLAPTDGVFDNLDFEDGFIYWSGEKYETAANKNVLASDNFQIVEEDGNKYLTLKETGYVKSIQTAYITASNVAPGDKLVIIYDAKGADATTFRPYLKQEGLRPVEYGADGLSTTLKPDGSGAIWNPCAGNDVVILGNGTEPTEFALQTAADGWKTYVTAVSAPVKVSTDVTSSAKEDIYLQLLISKDPDVSGTFDAAIDNLRIAKVTGEAGSEVYTDIATNTVIYPEPKYPSYLGTADKGFDSTTVASYKLKPLDGVFENLDFSDGFIGWAGRNNGGTDVYASDCYDLVTDGDNKYVKVKDSGYVTSMRSAVFSVDGIAAGDSVTVLYDVKGNDGGAFHIALRQIVMKAGVAYDAVTGQAADKVYVSDHNVVGSGVAASDFDVNLGAEGWTTRAGYKNVKVQELDPEGSDKYYLQMIVTCGDAGYAEAGDKLDAAIDNLRIAKVVDGVYTNVADGSVIYDPNAPVGGDPSDPGTGGDTPGTTPSTGDSVLALAALFFISGAAVFGTAKAMKNR